MAKLANGMWMSSTFDFVCVFASTSNIAVYSSLRLSGWRSVNALASHRCVPGSIPGVGMWDGHGHQVRQVGFLPHEDHPNAYIGANEHD